MVLTADERTSTFGNFHVVTGAYTAGGGTLDLSGQFSEILGFTCNADGAVPAAADLARTSNNALTVGITSADAAQVGRWIAIGRR